MTRILLAYDGSDDAVRAASLVRNLALPPDSTIRVIRVLEPTAVGMTPWAGGRGIYAPEIDSQTTAHYESEIAIVVRSLTDATRTADGVVAHGRPASVIVDEARAFAADLVVVGSRGRGSIASLLLGSVSGEIVDHAPCPILVARRAELTRVVLATDGSPSAATAEALLARSPIFAGLPIRVVSVADVPQPWHAGIAITMYGEVIKAYEQDLKRAKAEHQSIADQSTERLHAAGRDATSEVRTGDAASQIIEVADEWNADLVVLGSHGRSVMARLLLGSVARNLVHGSSASILVVRAAVER